MLFAKLGLFLKELLSGDVVLIGETLIALACILGQPEPYALLLNLALNGLPLGTQGTGAAFQVTV